MRLRHALVGRLALLLLGAAGGVHVAGDVWMGISSFNQLLRETGGMELSPAGALLSVSPQRAAQAGASSGPTDAAASATGAPEAEGAAEEPTPSATLGFCKRGGGTQEDPGAPPPGRLRPDPDR